MLKQHLKHIWKKLDNEPNKSTKNKALIATLKMLSKPQQKEIQNKSYAHKNTLIDIKVDQNRRVYSGQNRRRRFWHAASRVFFFV